MTGDGGITGRLREEYGLEWPPVRREDVRATVQCYRDAGTLLVAEAGGTPVGMGVRRRDDQTAEIKRMYVRKEARGLGAASAILDHLLTAAGDLGAATVKLDTVEFMSDGDLADRHAPVRVETRPIRGARRW